MRSARSTISDSWSWIVQAYWPRLRGCSANSTSAFRRCCNRGEGPGKRSRLSLKPTWPRSGMFRQLFERSTAWLLSPLPPSWSELRARTNNAMNRWRGVIQEYRKFLPVSEHTPIVTLGEGNTPLIRATRLAKTIAPGIDLYLKFEGANPTGSFKDRGMTVAISKAVEAGAQAVMCASTGNTSASAAAYGARAGLAVYV